MFTKLHIENFKAWQDTGPIRLAPLTVIFGANSAGKSSLAHLMLALKQTAISADRRRVLHLGDENTPVDLGTFAECLHNHQLDQPLRFAVGWQMPGLINIHDPLTGNEVQGDELALAVTLQADAQEQPFMQVMTYNLSFHRQSLLQAEYRRHADGAPLINTTPYKLVPVPERSLPASAPDKFYRFSDAMRASFRNAEFLADLALQLEAAFAGLYYLGPLRDYPKRFYTWSGETPESVGAKGEYAVAALLAATEQQRRFSCGAGQPEMVFDEFIAYWLQEMGIIDSFSVQPLGQGRREFEVLVKTHAQARAVKITDVGFGVSQFLPALVQAFYCPPGATVWMEQPELHLHPQVQAELADVFIAATQACENGQPRNAQLVIESHSEHFLNRLQRRVAEGRIAPEHVAVYFCRRNGADTVLEPLRMNADGEIENWPDNFFGDDMADIVARTSAALQRRMAGRSQS